MATLHMQHLAQPLKEAGIPLGKERLAVSQSVELGLCQHIKNHLPKLKTKVLWELSVIP